MLQTGSIYPSSIIWIAV